MKYIEPHAHMVSRVTDDYGKMALAGCVADDSVRTHRYLPPHDETPCQGPVAIC